MLLTARVHATVLVCWSTAQSNTDCSNSPLSFTTAVIHFLCVFCEWHSNVLLCRSVRFRASRYQRIVL